MWEELIATGIARLEFVHYPQHGAASDFAHNAAECAADQGRFWEFHDRLMEGDAALYGPAGATALASELGMDTGEFGACIADRRYLGYVREQQRDARADGVSFTPTIRVNGRGVDATADAVIAAARAAAE